MSTVKVITNKYLPNYQTSGSAGMDVQADFTNINTKFMFNSNFCGDGSIRIMPNGRALIPTGLKVAIPEGYEIQVRPRSGLALKNGITVLNTPGTIDARLQIS